MGRHWGCAALLEKTDFFAIRLLTKPFLLLKTTAIPANELQESYLYWVEL